MAPHPNRDPVEDLLDELEFDEEQEQQEQREQQRLQQLKQQQTPVPPVIVPEMRWGQQLLQQQLSARGPAPPLSARDSQVRPDRRQVGFRTSARPALAAVDSNRASARPVASRKPTPRKEPRSSYPKPPATAAADFGASAKTDWFAQRRLEKEAKEEAKQIIESQGMGHHAVDVLEYYVDQVEDILKQACYLSIASAIPEPPPHAHAPAASNARLASSPSRHCPPPRRSSRCSPTRRTTTRSCCPRSSARRSSRRSCAFACDRARISTSVSSRPRFALHRGFAFGLGATPCAQNE